MDKKFCLLCKRELDVPGVPESADCGGDCKACMDVEEEKHYRIGDTMNPDTPLPENRNG